MVLLIIKILISIPTTIIADEESKVTLMGGHLDNRNTNSTNLEFESDSLYHNFDYDEELSTNSAVSIKLRLKHPLYDKCTIILIV